RVAPGIPSGRADAGVAGGDRAGDRPRARGIPRARPAHLRGLRFRATSGPARPADAARLDVLQRLRAPYRGVPTGGPGRRVPPAGHAWHRAAPGGIPERGDRADVGARRAGGHRRLLAPCELGAPQAGAPSRVIVARRRRRLGFGLIAFGLTGLVLVVAAALLVLATLGAVGDAATGFERQRAQLLEMVDPAASALSDAADGAAHAGASLTRASDASRRAADLTGRM